MFDLQTSSRIISRTLGNLLERCVIDHSPSRVTESETLALEPSYQCFKKTSRFSDTHYHMVRLRYVFVFSKGSRIKNKMVADIK